MEKNRFWDEICPQNLRMANTLKNYTSKPESAYNNMPSQYYISIQQYFSQFGEH